LSTFYTRSKKDHFYQDKLGTNTGNVEKETFLQGESKAEKRVEGQNAPFSVFSWLFNFLLFNTNDFTKTGSGQT
jgi:hypothetical protein